jgi:single-strand DNA-binding protein
MANFNKVILAGNLTRDPQLSYLPSGTPVCEFGLAVNRRWKSQQTGEMREEVCFVDCRAFGRQGETINQYVRKGRPLLVDGRLKFDQWEGKDGQKRSRLSVVVEGFQFLDAPAGAGAGGARPPVQDRGAVPGRAAEGREEPPPPMEDVPAGGGDEVPF